MRWGKQVNPDRHQDRLMGASVRCPRFSLATGGNLKGCWRLAGGKSAQPPEGDRHDDNAPQMGRGKEIARRPSGEDDCVLQLPGVSPPANLRRPFGPKGGQRMRPRLMVR